MKKILSFLLCSFFVTTIFAQVLSKSGVENTLWTGFGQQYPEWNIMDYTSPNIRYYGLYETLQARIDVSQFTVEGMLNWAAETNWKRNDFDSVTFVNTQKTPFFYTNNSNQGGENTSGLTDSYYVNFIWNVVSKDKNDLDFGMGTRLAWKIGPAPACFGYYWEPYTHVNQGGLKEGVPGSADVVGYTHYDNLYANQALGVRYRYGDIVEAGISIPSGVTTNKPFFNAAFAIQPVDFFRAAVAFEDVGKDNTDFYSGLSLYLKKVIVDAYIEVQDIGNDNKDKTWGTGLTISWHPFKDVLLKPETGFTFYKNDDYTPAVYAGGRVEWTVNKQFILGGFTSTAWGSKNKKWKNDDWNGGFIFDLRPDVTYVLDSRNSFTAAFDYQYRIAYTNSTYSVWATGFYWNYRK